jgi:hypothetical protein
MSDNENQEDVVGVALKARDAVVALLIIAKILGKGDKEGDAALEAAATIAAGLKFTDQDAEAALRRATEVYGLGPKGFYEWMVNVSAEKLDAVTADMMLKREQNAASVMEPANA